MIALGAMALSQLADVFEARRRALELVRALGGSPERAAQFACEVSDCGRWFLRYGRAPAVHVRIESDRLAALLVLEFSAAEFSGARFNAFNAPAPVAFAAQHGGNTNVTLHCPVPVAVWRPEQLAALRELLNRQTREQLTDSLYLKNSALVEAMASVEAMARERGQFFANMSHEIRTPMNAIIGLSGLCLQTELGDKQRDYVTGVNRSARALLLIINDILDFSKIDLSKLELEQAHFRLQSSIEQIDSITGHLAREKDLHFECSIAAEVPPFLVGDALRLGQVLLNLTSNAVKFTERGRVSVEVLLHEPAGQPVPAVAQDTVALEFRVHDSGIGMDEVQIRGLFEAFSQADTSSTRKYGGTGLGLAICKGLVGLMGGRIWVQSEPGVGSCFYFTARFGIGEASRESSEIGGTTAGAVTAARARLAGARILVAEDNEFNQQVIEELLEQCGAVVMLCGDGREALEQLAKERFDIVLMDVQMPVMDGLEATRRIRATPGLAGQRVIAMTANVTVEDRARCLEAGMDDFETKPIDPAHLYLTLAKWLPAGAAVQSTAALETSSGVAGGG